ncbi:MAG: hypothetical protein ACOCXX_00845 [Planctomycetota bacterium]
MNSSNTVIFLRRAATASAVVAVVAILPAMMLGTGAFRHLRFQVHMHEGVPLVVQTRAPINQAGPRRVRVLRRGDDSVWSTVLERDIAVLDSCLWRGRLVLVSEKSISLVDPTTGQQHEVSLPGSVLRTTLVSAAPRGDVLWICSRSQGSETLRLWSMTPAKPAEEDDASSRTETGAPGKMVFQEAPSIDLKPLVGTVEPDFIGIVADREGLVLNWFMRETRHEPVADKPDDNAEPPENELLGYTLWAARFVNDAWTEPRRLTPRGEKTVCWAWGTTPDGRALVMRSQVERPRLDMMTLEDDRWVQVASVPSRTFEEGTFDIALTATDDGLLVAYAQAGMAGSALSVRPMSSDYGWTGEVQKVAESETDNRLMLTLVSTGMLAFMAMTVFGLAFLVLRVRELKQQHDEFRVQEQDLMDQHDPEDQQDHEADETDDHEQDKS